MVAGIIGTCEAHQLNVLSDDACWSLFEQCAFGSDKERCQKFEAIGREIVRKCGGLPLAAQALGGLLRFKKTNEEWLEIKESKLWDFPDESHILPALRLSYFHLTPTLKLCFAFCAIFPKDTEIMKEELIHLWMANAFIQPSIKHTDVKDVGNMIWNELQQKSFFQDIKIDDDTRQVISFKMHDLIHDLAQSVAGQECVILDDAKVSDLSKSTHYVSFGVDGGQRSFSKTYFEKFESLRTEYQVDLYKEISCSIASNQSLRVLRAGDWFPLPSVGNLIHLRYLELRGNENIDSPKITEFIHCEKGDRAQLGTIAWPKLSEAEKANLKGKKDLRALVLSWNIQGSSLYVDVEQEQVLEGLQPHSNLKSLGIISYDGLRLASWLGDSSSTSLGNLIDLTLSNCRRCQRVGALGKLPSLKRLYICYMDNVQDVDDECYNDVEMTRTVFPSLEELALEYLPNLKLLLKTERRDIFPCLSELDITGCPKLDALPKCVLHLTSLRRLWISECPILSRRCKEEYSQKLAYIPNKDIENQRILRKKPRSYIGGRSETEQGSLDK
ncbi:hypothetical protein PIB30_085484, partial [Stylosanthes scabra]|nr:hypothetical protein [Stylosanthes scabra]